LKFSLKVVAMDLKRNSVVSDVETFAQDDLVVLYNKLAESYCSVKKDLDDCKQELHHQVLQTKMLTSSQNDLQIELENINSYHKQELEAETKKGTSVIDNLKLRIQDLVSDKNLLEQSVHDLNNLVFELKRQCNELRENAVLKPVDQSDEFCREHEMENENLRLEIKDLQKKLSDLTMKNSEQCATVESLNEKLVCLEQNLDCRKLEIEEKNEVIDSMQEKVLELSVDLASFKRSTDTSK
jgi:chromosome segregation ATPase